MCIGWRDLDYPQVVCPECEGYGYNETITQLFYNGYVGSENRKCETCKGEGFVIEAKESEE
jgi:DnaJ-class molecular chaperone